MKNNRQKQGFILAGLLLLTVGVFCPIWRDLRQVQLNRELIEAVQQNDTEAALTLLEEGANANARKEPQQQSILRYWLTRIAPGWHHENSRSQFPGLSLLAIAVSKDNPTLVNALLEHGASNVNGRTVIESVLSQEDLGRQFDTNPTLLIAAAERGNVEMVRTLLEHGANTETRGDEDETALISAVQNAPDPQNADDSASSQRRKDENAYLIVTQLLLDHGANINAKSQELGMALWCATDHNEIELARLLLDRGADPNLHTSDSWPSFLVAAGNGNIPMMQLLLKHHININWQSPEDGASSLQQAVLFAKPEAVRFLLEHGAKVDTGNRTDDTLLDEVARRQQPGGDVIIRLLKAYGAKQ